MPSKDTKVYMVYFKFLEVLLTTWVEKGKRFHCSRCERSFTQAWNRDRHEQTHSDSTQVETKLRSSPQPYNPKDIARGKRARWSCEKCRSRKTRCDGHRPVCGSCTGRFQCSWEGPTSQQHNTTIVDQQVIDLSGNFWWGGPTGEQDGTTIELFVDQPVVASSGNFECWWGGETSQQYDTTIEFFFEQLYPLYPVVDRSVFASMYRSARNPLQNETEYLWAIIDSICSLAAVYMNDSELFDVFYGRAKARMESIQRLSIEAFASYTILVRYC